MKPHKHAEVIKAWADGKAIQSRDPAYGQWRWNDCENPTWALAGEYRIKPEYPLTNMTDHELHEIARIAIFESKPFSDRGVAMRRAIANAAIERAINDGQVVIKEQDNG